MQWWRRWIRLCERRGAGGGRGGRDRGEEEDSTVGEGGEEGGLVDVVEGAWFEFTYSVRACVLVERKGKNGRDREKERGRGERDEERKTEKGRKEEKKDRREK